MLATSGANATEQFRAYGAVRGYSGSNPSRYQFTGQYIDDSSLYYNARYYDPQIGSFLSPDTLVPDPGNVQAYNRYLYALGNPIRYNDPSGHCVDGISTVVCVAVGLGLAGGTANAVGNTAGQVIRNYQSGQSLTESVSNIRYGEVGIAFGAGFASGASAPFTGGIGGAIVTNALIGGAQSAATQMFVDGKGIGEINKGDVAVGATLGGAAGLVQGALLKDIPAKELTQSALYGGSKVVTSLGVSTDPYIMAVAPKSGSVFREMINSAQIQSTVSVRALAGVAVANAPVPSVTCSGFFNCISENANQAWSSATSFFTGDDDNK